MNKLFTYSAIFPAVFIILISIFFIPAIVIFYKSQGIPVNLKFLKGNNSDSSQFVLNGDSKFIWPTPNYTNITSSFGYRAAPTTGASTYHGAIDIGAPQGTPILAIADGIVTSAGWNGGNGYAVTIDYENGIKSTYGHVSPNFVVSKGDIVSQGQIVANVGPKYVEKQSYTTYVDSARKIY